MASLNPFKQRWQQWFARRFPPTNGPVAVSTQRVYILPTAGGWAFLSMLGALWLFAINYSNNLIYLLLFWLAGLGLLALVHTHRQLVGLSLEVLPLMPQFANEPLHIRLRVNNPGKKTARGLILDPAWVKRSKRGIASNVCDVADSAILAWLPPPPGRGTYTAPLLRLSTIYPLGLYRAWTFIYQPVEVLRYPAPLAEVALPARKLADNEVVDGTSATVGSDEFDGLRRYRNGDAPRHVAWRTAAKRGGLLAASVAANEAAKPITSEFAELQTRRFIANGEQQLHLELQVARAAVMQEGVHFGTSISTEKSLPPVDELALSLLCRQVLMAREQGLSFRLTTNDKVAADAAAAHPDAVLAELALYGLGSDQLSPPTKAPPARKAWGLRRG